MESQALPATLLYILKINLDFFFLLEENKVGLYTTQKNTVASQDQINTQ